MKPQSSFAVILVLQSLLVPVAGAAQDVRLGERTATNAEVLPGVDVLLRDSLHLVEGRRVGLVTNHTGISAVESRGGAAVSSIDLLWEHPDVHLVALFSPEHGIRGDAEPGVLVDDGLDEHTGLPVHSLYGESRRPPAGSLDELDALLFDIQDVGARYYTYVYTMALAMEEAGRAGIPFVVLDRPNPIGGRLVQGNVLDPEFSSFVGMYPLPMRHGMTPGELALLFQGAYDVEVDLHVVPVEGWTREHFFTDTDLPWVPPSPNMPSVDSALHYPGTCLFEGTNLSVGRGTDDLAFQVVAAPWLPAERLAQIMNEYQIPGAYFEAVTFTPSEPGDGKFDGVEVEGVRLIADHPEVYDPTLVGVLLLKEIRRIAGHDWQWRASHFDRLAGTDRLRDGIDRGLDVQELRTGWIAELQEFLELREPFLLYP